VKVW
jgi:hypothetical protein